jgi:hypothetical protein
MLLYRSGRGEFLKKSFSIIFFLLFLCTGLCAVPLSAGVGLDLDFDNTDIKAEYNNGLNLKAELSYTGLNYGISGFFDAKYLVVGFGFAGVSKWVKTTAGMSMVTGTDPEDISLYGNALSLSLYGKLPFEFSDFTIYPILGVELKIMLSLLYAEDSPEGWDRKKQGDSYQGNAKDWTAFWGRVGVGADFNVGDSFFIRGTLTFGLKVNTAREAFIMEKIQKEPDHEFSVATSFGYGIKASIAIGFSVGEFSGFGGGGGGRGGGGGGRGGGGSDIYYPQ